MRCSRAEKFLYLFSDGRRENNLPAEAQTHLRSCMRCSSLFAQLQAVNTVLTDRSEAAAPIPQDEVDKMVSASLRRRAAPRRGSAWEWLRGLPVPGVAAACAAVLVAAAVGWYTGWIFHGSAHLAHIENAGAAAAAAHNGQQVVTVSCDSTLHLGRNCAVRLHRGGRCTVLRAEETAAIIDLQYGSILLSARKGSYDTLAVACGAARVYATGTHFEVDRSHNGMGVSVLEGAVKVVYAGENEAPVNALETWTFNSRENAGRTEALKPEKRRQMINDFVAMTAADTRLGLLNSLSGGSGVGAMYPNIQLARIQPSQALRQGRTFTDDSAAARQYAIAKNMIHKGRYAPAAAVLQEYLKKFTTNADSAAFDLAFCCTNLRRYADAIAAYERVVDNGVDEQLVETALHRSNKILYLKLKESEEARSGISRYLKKYPQGIWRDEELYYGIQLAFALGNSGTADSLSRVFAAEFPGNCRAYALLKRAESSAR